MFGWNELQNRIGGQAQETTSLGHLWVEAGSAHTA